MFSNIPIWVGIRVFKREVCVNQSISVIQKRVTNMRYSKSCKVPRAQKEKSGTPPHFSLNNMDLRSGGSHVLLEYISMIV